MKMKAITLSLLLMGGMSIVGVAQSPATEKAPKAQAQQAHKATQAKVVKVDAEKSELSVKDDKGAEHAVKVAAQTKITRDGKDITLADIKSGDSVVFEFDSADNTVAKSITVMPGKTSGS